MIRLLLPPLLSLLLITACGGGGTGSTSAPDQPLDLDAETGQSWRLWAIRAQQIASLTEDQYRAPALTPARASEQQGRAERLAAEIRSAASSTEPVLRLADDLDELIEGLQFGIEYSTNTGASVIAIRIPTLEEAFDQLAEDADAVIEMLQED